MNERKKILLVRTDRLGDVVLTLPMLPVLRRHFPDAHLAMLVSAYPAEILHRNQYLDEVLLYDDSVKLVPFFQLLRSLRMRRFDTVVVVHPTPRLALLAFLAGIPIRVGTGYRWYSFLFNRRVFEHRKDSKRHETEYNLNLLTALGCQWKPPVEFPIQIPEEDDDRVTKLLKKLPINVGEVLMIFHPGSGGSARDWSPSNFGRLAAECVEKLGARAILTGGKGEESVVQAAMKEIPRGAVNLTGQLSLLELAALIRKADVFVSNSTGPLHIAAAVGTALVGIYPPILECGPQRWGPCTSKKRVFVPDRNLCPRCQGGECEGSDCMDQITVDQVFAAIEELLQASRRKTRGARHAQTVSS